MRHSAREHTAETPSAFLTELQRRTVLDKVLTLVDAKFSGNDVNVRHLHEVHEARVLNSETPEDFEQALDALLRDLKTSHTGCFTKHVHARPGESRWPQR